MYDMHVVKYVYIYVLIQLKLLAKCVYECSQSRNCVKELRVHLHIVCLSESGDFCLLTRGSYKLKRFMNLPPTARRLLVPTQRTEIREHGFMLGLS